MPEGLRRIVKRVAVDWEEKKCRPLAARLKLLVAWADSSPKGQEFRVFADQRRSVSGTDGN